QIRPSFEACKIFLFGRSGTISSVIAVPTATPAPAVVLWAEAFLKLKIPSAFLQQILISASGNLQLHRVPYRYGNALHRRVPDVPRRAEDPDHRLCGPKSPA